MHGGLGHGGVCQKRAVDTIVGDGPDEPGGQQRHSGERAGRGVAPEGPDAPLPAPPPAVSEDQGDQIRSGGVMGQESGGQK